MIIKDKTTKDTITNKNQIKSLSQSDYNDILMKFNINFHIDIKLLTQSLTHKSALVDKKEAELLSNERLEYLGDSVLKLIMSQWLYENYPYFNEGDMTKVNGYVVSDYNLAKVAKELDLGKYLIFGKTEISSGGAFKESIIASALEAIIGAIFLSSGFENIKSIIIDLMKPTLIDALAGKATETNYKANLQEISQSRFQCLPQYEIIVREGPCHAPSFVCVVKIDSQVLGIGKGQSKKQAEQESAKMALKILV